MDIGIALMGFFFLGYVAASVRERWRLYRKSRRLLVAQEILELVEALEKKWGKPLTSCKARGKVRV